MPDMTTPVAGPALGTPTWLELQTDDVAGTRAFLGELLGIAFGDVDGKDYAVALAGGQPVFGLAPGSVSRWVQYLHVDEANAVAERAAELGGSVEAVESNDDGDWVVVTTPSGATCGVCRSN